MKSNLKTVKTLLVIAFSLILATLILVFILSSLFILFGVGYSGGEITFIEIVWMLRTLVLFFMLSSFALIGIVRKKAMGFTTGAAVSIAGGILAITSLFIELFNGAFEFINIIIYLSITILSIAILIGISKLNENFRNIQKQNIIVCCIIAISLLVVHFIL